MVNGDPTIIGTILRNLVSNAVKFCFNGGSIGVEVNEDDDGKKTICVWDTGVVISPERVARIMRAGEVSSTNGTNGETGTGLGLQLCNTFLALHGSRLLVTSSEAKTVFSFVL